MLHCYFALNDIHAKMQFIDVDKEHNYVNTEKLAFMPYRQYFSYLAVAIMLKCNLIKVHVNGI